MAGTIAHQHDSHPYIFGFMVGIDKNHPFHMLTNSITCYLYFALLLQLTIWCVLLLSLV
jgi:hypothetical protein